MKRMLKIVLIIVPIILIAGGGYYYFKNKDDNIIKTNKNKDAILISNRDENIFAFRGYIWETQGNLYLASDKEKGICSSDKSNYNLSLYELTDSGMKQIENETLDACYGNSEDTIRIGLGNQDGNLCNIIKNGSIEYSASAQNYVNGFYLFCEFEGQYISDGTSMLKIHGNKAELVEKKEKYFIYKEKDSNLYYYLAVDKTDYYYYDQEAETKILDDTTAVLIMSWTYGLADYTHYNLILYNYKTGALINEINYDLLTEEVLKYCDFNKCIFSDSSKIVLLNLNNLKMKEVTNTDAYPDYTVSENYFYLELDNSVKIFDNDLKLKELVINSHEFISFDRLYDSNEILTIYTDGKTEKQSFFIDLKNEKRYYMDKNMKYNVLDDDIYSIKDKKLVSIINGKSIKEEIDGYISVGEEIDDDKFKTKAFITYSTKDKKHYTFNIYDLDLKKINTLEYTSLEIKEADEIISSYQNTYPYIKIIDEKSNIKYNIINILTMEKLNDESLDSGTKSFKMGNTYILNYEYYHDDEYIYINLYKGNKEVSYCFEKDITTGFETIEVIDDKWLFLHHYDFMKKQLLEIQW